MSGVICDAPFPKDSHALREAFERHYLARKRALNSLMRINMPGQLRQSRRDLSFVSEYNKLITQDDDCLCGLVTSPGRGRPHSSLHIGKSFGKGKVGEAFLMETDDGQQKYIIKKIAAVEPLPTYIGLWILLESSSDEALWSAMLQMNPSVQHNLTTFYKECQPPTKGVLVLKCGGFTSQTCMHMLLNEILLDNPNYVYQYDAFYCGSAGYTLLDIANQGDLSSYLDKLPQRAITGSFLTDMLSQIMSPLTILKHPMFGFVHADLKCRNVFVHIDTENRPIFKLADFDKSSIFWHGVRFHNIKGDFLSNEDSSWAIPKYTYKLLDFPTGRFTAVNMGCLTSAGMAATIASSIRTCVRPGTEVQLYTMHGPYGFFLTFDVYTFMISCMMEPKIWQYYRMSSSESPETQGIPEGGEKNNGFVQFWKGLFTESQRMILDITIDMKHDQYELEPDATKPAVLAQMRSITYHSDLIFTMQGGLWLLANYDDILEVARAAGLDIDIDTLLNTPRLKSIIEESRVALAPGVLSHGKKLCLDECKVRSEIALPYIYSGSKTCNTNIYSKKGQVYSWDYC